MYISEPVGDVISKNICFVNPEVKALKLKGLADNTKKG